MECSNSTTVISWSFSFTTILMIGAGKDLKPSPTNMPLHKVAGNGKQEVFDEEEVISTRIVF